MDIPSIIMEMFKDELKRQENLFDIDMSKLETSNKPICLHTVNNTWISPRQFNHSLRIYLKKNLKVKYGARDFHYTSAVIAIHAHCDLPAVADIIGMTKAVEMFKDLRKFDIYEEKENNGAALFFDEIYKNRKQNIKNDCVPLGDLTHKNKILNMMKTKRERFNKTITNFDKYKSRKICLY